MDTSKIHFGHVSLYVDLLNPYKELIWICFIGNQPTPPDIKCDKYGACAVTEGGQNEFREQEGNRGIGGGTERPTLPRQPTTRQPGSNNGTTTDMTTTTLSARQEALNRFCRFVITANTSLPGKNTESFELLLV